MDRDSDAAATLRRRLDRERAARREAEAIAERATADLYASKSDLQRANAELQALNDALREFVAVASHDLRGPLTTILGTAALLARRWSDVSDERRDEMLRTTERQARHLARLIDDLLTVSKIEAGVMDPEKEAVLLRDVVRRVVADFGGHTGDIQVVAADVGALVDRDHLQRILSNYVGNALKYGEPPIEVQVREAGEWAEILVRDRGHGVPEDLVPRLFGKFARGALSRQKGGTGLGLSIVQGLARANGGDTWYEPNEPHGSCFGVRLRKSVA